MIIALEDPSLIVLIGPSGAGKSTFAHRHFLPTEVVSSDFCRELVSDDQRDQSATDDAFELLHLILAKRMSRRRTTVVDATNVQRSSREPLIALAMQNNILSVAIVFALPATLCLERNHQRTQRQVQPDVIQHQLVMLAESVPHLQSEGFHSIFTLSNTDEITVTRNVV